MCVSCLNPRPTRFVSSLFFLLLTVAAPVVAQQPAVPVDETTVGVLAALLAASDARRFDPAPLREALSHPNPGVRRQGALAAGRIGDGGAVDLLLPVLHDSVPTVQAAAAFALGAAALVRALSDPDPQTRTVAARGISKALVDSARLDPRDAIAALCRLLTDGDAHIRINVLRALASFRDSSVAGAVVPLVADRDIGVAVQAETTLGVVRGAAALAALEARLTSSVFAIKRQALIAMAQADSAAGVAAALAVGSDGDWRWRSVAAEAFGAARARDRLEGQLADADGRVVAQALQMLQRIVPATDSSLPAKARA